ncbi:MAG TPA: cation transporter [Reyranella sp.]|nr:cation transporter [Reyranella sp.]
MAGCCDHCHDDADTRTPRYRRVLWIALGVNLAMFAVELGFALQARSVSLLTDSLDFLGDAANYGVSLLVVGMALAWRARAALLKAATMAAFGVWAALTTVQHAVSGTVPDAPIMGVVGVLALLANLGVAAMLYRYRDGDSNMLSVWVCTRNDAIGNIAVLVAAAGVVGTRSGWPDLVVGAIMATIALSGAWRVARQAMRELRGSQEGSVVAAE